ncbi:uncharacterized protein J8A68_005314, partial [[Candida] subhashii]
TGLGGTGGQGGVAGAGGFTPTTIMTQSTGLGGTGGYGGAAGAGGGTGCTTITEGTSGGGLFGNGGVAITCAAGDQILSVGQGGMGGNGGNVITLIGTDGQGPQKRGINTRDDSSNPDGSQSVAPSNDSPATSISVDKVSPTIEPHTGGSARYFAGFYIVISFIPLVML